MKITCPNCTTSYQVPDDYIGEEGRAVRCANCGETWQANSEPAVSEPAALEEGLDTSQSDIDALFDEGPAEEQSQDDIDALFDSPAGGEEQSQDDIDSLFDSPAGGEEQSQDDIDSLFDSPAAEEEQNQDDIDALFGESDASPAAEPADASSSSPMMVTADEDHALPPVVEGLDADSFEAHKAMARGRDIESSVRRRKRSNRRRKAKSHVAHHAGSQNEWVIGGAALAACLVILLGLFALPQTVVKLVPDFASLYRMAGMDVNLAGVTFDAVDVSLVQQAGAPVVSVQAELVNPGAEPVILPSIQLSILGNDATELYSWAVDPDGGVGLGPGERKVIETTVAAPSQARELALRIFH